MKSRIICLCLCVVAVAISMLMTVNLINSEDYDPPVISLNKNTDTDETKPTDKNSPIKMTENAISGFADRVETFVETLAYSENREYEKDLSYIIENLDNISSYLSSDEVSDTSGAKYISSLSSAFKSAKEGFIDDRDFSTRVGEILKNIESAKNELDSNKESFYPQIDTDVNGAFTLALLSMYEKSISSPDTFTVTVGGGALLGDRLGTSADLKFSEQVEKHKYLYPFYSLSSVTANDDITFISLEAPLTTATDSESFNPSKGSPEYAKSLLGIDAVTLASSAIMDYGKEGFDDTVKALHDSGISYSVQEGSQTINSDFGKVVYITFDLTQTPVTDEQKERNKEVIKNAVETEKISGADLVVGYGSRVAQGIEEYNGKYIVYETGDLSYSGTLDTDQKNTEKAFMFRQTFKKTASGIKPLSYRIIPLINTSEDNLYLPTLVFDEKADEIIENLVYESRYFSNAITDFNYIKIEK